MYRFNNKTYSPEAMANIASVKGYSLDELLTKNPTIEILDEVEDDNNGENNGEETNVEKQGGAQINANAAAAPSNTVSTSENTSLATSEPDKSAEFKSLLKLPQQDWAEENWEDWVKKLEENGSKEAKEKIKEYNFAKENYLTFNPQGQTQFELVSETVPSQDAASADRIAKSTTSPLIMANALIAGQNSTFFKEQNYQLKRTASIDFGRKRYDELFEKNLNLDVKDPLDEEWMRSYRSKREQILKEDEYLESIFLTNQKKLLEQSAFQNFLRPTLTNSLDNEEPDDIISEETDKGFIINRESRFINTNSLASLSYLTRPNDGSLEIKNEFGVTEDYWMDVEMPDGFTTLIDGLRSGEIEKINDDAQEDGFFDDEIMVTMKDGSVKQLPIGDISEFNESMLKAFNAPQNQWILDKDAAVGGQQARFDILDKNYNLLNASSSTELDEKAKLNNLVIAQNNILDEEDIVSETYLKGEYKVLHEQLKPIQDEIDAIGARARRDEDFRNADANGNNIQDWIELKQKKVEEYNKKRTELEINTAENYKANNLRKAPQIYDLLTGKFIDQNQASTNTNEINDGINFAAKTMSFNSTPVQLEQSRHEAISELVYLGKQLLKDYVRYSYDMEVGDQIQSSVFRGYDPQADITQITGIRYLSEKLREMESTGTIPEGLVLAQDKNNLAAQRYNRALQDFMVINKALELNIDERKTEQSAWGDYLAAGTRDVFGVSNIMEPNEIIKSSMEAYKRFGIMPSAEDLQVFNDINDPGTGERFLRAVPGIVEMAGKFYLAGAGVTSLSTRFGLGTEGLGAWVTTSLNQTKMGRSMFGRRWTQMMGMGVQEAATIGGYNMMSSDDQDINYAFVLGSAPVNSLYRDFLKYSHGLSAVKPDRISNMMAKGFQRNPLTATGVRQTVAPLISTVAIASGGQVESLVLGHGVNLNALSFESLSDTYLQMFFLKNLNPKAQIGEWKEALMSNLALKAKTSKEVVKSLKETDLVPQGKKTLSAEEIDALDPLEIQKSKEKSINDILGEGEETGVGLFDSPGIYKDGIILPRIYPDPTKMEGTMDYSGLLNDGYIYIHPISGKNIIVNEAQRKSLEKLEKNYNTIEGFKTYRTILNMEDALNGLNTYINDESAPILMRMYNGRLTSTDIEALGTSEVLNDAFSAKFAEQNPSPNAQQQVKKVQDQLTAQQPVFQAIMNNAQLFPKGKELGTGGRRNTYINLSYNNAKLRGDIAQIEQSIKKQDKLNGGSDAAQRLQLTELKQKLAEGEAKEVEMITTQKAINNLKLEMSKKLGKEYSEEIGKEDVNITILGPKEFAAKGEEFKPSITTKDGEVVINDILEVDQIKGSKGVVMSTEGDVYKDGKKINATVNWKEGVSVDGSPEIIINEAWAKKIYSPSVITHEITHKITDKAWKNISKESQDIIVKGFVDNIQKDIDPLTFVKLKNQVQKHNGGKTFKENPNTVEWINIFHDMVSKEQIPFEKNKNIFKSLGSTLERVLGTGGSKFENMDWSNPKQVYDFIKEFSITSQKGEKSAEFIKEFKRLQALENNQYLTEDVEIKPVTSDYSATTNPQKLALSLIPKSKAQSEPQEVAKVQTMLVEGVPSLGINKGFKDMTTLELMEAREKLKNFNINNKEADISVKKDNSLGIQSINKLLGDPQNAVNVLAIEGKQKVVEGESPLTVAFEMVGAYNPTNPTSLGPMGRRYLDLIKSRADELDRRYNLPGAKKLFDTEQYMIDMFGHEQGLTSIIKTYLQGKVDNTNPNGYINDLLKKRGMKAFEDNFEGEINQYETPETLKKDIPVEVQGDVEISAKASDVPARTTYVKSGVVPTEKLSDVQDAVIRLGMGGSTLDTKITGGAVGKSSGKQSDINKIDEAVVAKFTADIKKNMGGGQKYIDWITNNQDLLNNIDLDVLTKFNMFPFYQPKIGADGKQVRIETVKGKSQPLQFEKRTPTIEEILSWVNAEGKAASTKGTRKDALARAIAIGMGRDIAMDAQSSAANTGGFVPKINSKGEYTYTKYPVNEQLITDKQVKAGDVPTDGVYFSQDGKKVYVNGLERPVDGTVIKVNTNKNGKPESIEIAESYDIYRDLSPSEKADAMMEGALNSIGVRLKRDPNLKFAATSNDATGLLTIQEGISQISGLTREILNLDPSKKNKADILEYVDINYPKLNKTLRENDIELIDIIDDAINRSIYADNRVKELEGDLVEGGNYPTLAKDLNQNFENYGSGHIVLNARTQSGPQSWAENPIEKAQFGNTMYGALTDKNMAGIIETQALYKSMGFGNFKIIGPDGKLKRLGSWIPGENQSERIANAWNMPGEIAITGEGKLPKDVDAFYIASPGKIQADPVLVKGEKVIIEIDGVKQYKYKPTSIQGFFQKLALEGKLENGRMTDPADIKEYTTMLRTQLTKKGINPYTNKPYTFEETIAANKALSKRMYTSLYNQLSNVTLTPAEKKAGITVEQKENRIANDIFSWMRMQTNISEGIAKGTFTITTAPLELGSYVPTKNLESKGYDPYAFKRTHSEHHVPMGVVNGNIMNLMVKYKNNPKKFKQELDKLMERAEQGIITVDAQKWADNPINRGSMKIGPYNTNLNQFATMPWSIERLAGTNYLQPLDIQVDLRTGSPLRTQLIEESTKDVLKLTLEKLETPEKIDMLNNGSIENQQLIEETNQVARNEVQNTYLEDNKLDVGQGNPTQTMEVALNLLDKRTGTPELNTLYKNTDLDLQKLAKDNGINYSAVPLDQQSSSMVYEQIKVREKAEMMANRSNAPEKKVYLSDIDDSFLYTDSKIDVTMPDGRKFKIDPKEFNEDAGKYLLEAQEMDGSYTAADLFSFGEFGDFKNARKAKAYKVVERVYDKNIKEGKDGWDGLYFLTSRKGDMATALAFQYRLEQLSGGKLKVPLDHYIGVEGSDPQLKANYVDVFASLGYNNFVFLEDAAPNIAAFSKRVKELGLIDRPRPIKASATSIEQNQFDNMIEHSSGIKANARYSDANVKKLAPKGTRLLPYNTMNYMQLIQTMAGKGSRGLRDYEYVKEKSYDTYKRAQSDQDRFEVNYQAGLNTVFKTYSDFNKTLNNEAFNGWTVQDAVRIAAWKQQGMEEIPGLSKKDFAGITKFIEANPDVQSMANELVRVGGVAGYYMPTSADWVLGSIQGDAQLTVQRTARKYYQDLSGYTSFVETYYTPENLNKLEIAYGTKYRKALEDMLRRMKSGSNRPIGDNFGLQGLNNIINQTTTAQLALNVGSAVRQGQSNLNYMFEPGNNPWQAGKAFADQKRYWRETIDLYNDDFLVSRRKGNKINISDAEITDALNGSTNKAGAILNLLLQKGLVLNKTMDSWAQANGFGTTYVMNKTNELLGLDYRLTGQLYDIKTGKNIKGNIRDIEGYAEARSEAVQKWRELNSRTQQSNNPIETGSIQTKVGGKAFLSYGTTAMQNLRQANIELNKLLKGWNVESLEDVENIKDPQTRRELLTKIFNYGMLQNSVYGALTSGFTSWLISDDTEEGELGEIGWRVLNSEIDGTLTGFGVGGKILIGGKDAATKFYNEYTSDKNMMFKDYEGAGDELFGMIPALGQKIDLFDQASFDLKAMEQKKNRFNTALENPLEAPSVSAAASIIQGTTGFPAKRALYDNIKILEYLTVKEGPVLEKIGVGLGLIPLWETDQAKAKKLKSPKTNPFNQGFNVKNTGMGQKVF